MRYLRITPNATSQSVNLHILKDDGTANTALLYNTSGVAVSYVRDTGSTTAINLVTLASATASYSSGGFIHVANGVYRLDLPNAAIASGATRVSIIVAETTDIRPVQTIIDLDDATGTRSTFASGGSVNVTQLAGATVATSGSGTVTFKLGNTLATVLDLPSLITDSEVGSIRGVYVGSHLTQYTLPADVITSSAIAASAGTEIGTAVWATTERTLTSGGGASVADIVAALSGSTITIVSPVLSNGSIAIVRGDDYTSANTITLTATLSGTAENNQTHTLRILRRSVYERSGSSGLAEIEVTATATHSASTVTVAFALTHTQTATLASTYPVDGSPTHVYQWINATTKRTLAIGELNATRQIEPSS